MLGGVVGIFDPQPGGERLKPWWLIYGVLFEACLVGCFKVMVSHLNKF